MVKHVENISHLNSSYKKIYMAWFAAALFFLYQYLLRVAPGVMEQDLRQEFKLSAEQFSTLGAFYLYTYSLLQIPLGIIIDRVGVPKTIFFSTLLCIFGTTMLAFADAFWQVQLSRILIGAGSAAAFMSSIKVVADNLPEGNRGILLGLTLVFGTVGALSAGHVLVGLIEHFGWRDSVKILAFVGLFIFAIGVVFLSRLPSKQKSIDPFSFPDLKKSFITTVKNKNIFLYALLAIGFYTPLAVLADLWGSAFLMQKYGFDRGLAAKTTMLTYLGLGIGSLFLPWFVDKYKVIDKSIRICILGMIASFAAIIYGPNYPIFLLIFFIMLVGFFSSSEMICFTGAVRHTSASNSGMTIGFVNTMNMLGGGLVQHFVGISLDWLWAGQKDANGIRVYETQDFVIALSSLVGLISVCALVSFTIRDKKPKAIKQPS